MTLWADTSAPDIMAQERTGARVSLTRPVLTCPVNSQAAQTHVAREGCNVIYITYVTRWCRVTGDR